MRSAISSSTTIRTGLGIFGLSLGMLSGCGGGDPVTLQTPTTTATVATYVTSSGSASPAFAANGNLRYLVIGPGKDILGAYSNVALNDQFGSGTAGDIGFGPSGEVVRLGANTLADVSTTNKYAVQKIAGDAAFAQGRWSKGAVTNAGGTVTLSGTDNQAFHYLAFNALTAFPAAGSTRTCTSLKETGASYVGDTRIGETTTVGVAVLAGQVKIEFDGAGNATVPINISAAAQYPSPSFNSIYSETFVLTLANAAPASGTFQPSRSFNSPGLGNMVVMGAGDSAGLGAVILLGVAYRVQLDSGFNYQGIISLRCS
jgi:hypothetical protein